MIVPYGLETFVVHILSQIWRQGVADSRVWNISNWETSLLYATSVATSAAVFW